MGTPRLFQIFVVLGSAFMILLIIIYWDDEERYVPRREWKIHLTPVAAELQQRQDGAPVADPGVISKGITHNSGAHLSLDRFWHRYGMFSRNNMKGGEEDKQEPVPPTCQGEEDEQGEEELEQEETEQERDSHHQPLPATELTSHAIYKINSLSPITDIIVHQSLLFIRALFSGNVDVEISRYPNATARRLLFKYRGSANAARSARS
ncbi:unnamed protein product [Merluccius merluccius]